MGGHDPHSAVAIDPYLPVLIPQIAQLDSGINGVMKDVFTPESFGAVLCAVKVRSDQTSQDGGVVSFHGLGPIVFSFAEVCVGFRVRRLSRCCACDSRRMMVSCPTYHATLGSWVAP